MATFSEQDAPPHISFVSFGVQINAYATHEEDLALIEPLLPPDAKRVPANLDARGLGLRRDPDGTYSVYSGTTRVSEGTNIELALVVLEGQIRSWVATNSPHMTFIHAGAVEHEGRALIVPGASFSGKTTLVAALVRQGARYFSDEYAVVDRDGLIHPYAKALSIRPPGTTGQQVDSTPESLGGVTGDRAVPLSLAVVTYYVPNAEWKPRRLSPGEGALALMANTVPAQSRPAETMEVLTRALKDAVVLQGERGEADEFAAMLLNGRAF